VKRGKNVAESDVGKRAPLSASKKALLEKRLRSGVRAATSGQTGAIQRRTRSGPLPLSFAQQRLWFLEQLEPESPLYNICAAVRIEGALDVDALGMSVQTLVDRHESFRTTFSSADGIPVQIVSEKGSSSLAMTDLTGGPESNRMDEALRIAAEEFRRPFDLTRGPLLRLGLIRLGGQDHLLLITMHHIVSDGWSMGIFIDEMAACYEAYASGTAPRLAELPIQYADFALWQREWLTGDLLETQLSYWKKALSGSSLVLQLPTDRPRPEVQTFNGRRYPIQLSRALSESLNALSRSEGATLFMTLLAAFKALLYRYTDQDDIIVGSPIANRNRVEVEGLIGFFVNTLVLRTDLSGEPSFRQLLARVRETALGAYAHQDLPFERLVEELQPERDMSYNPLFQVMFALQNIPQRPWELPGLKVTPLDVDAGTAKFDLTLEVVERTEGISGCFEYNTDLFDTETIERMAAHFTRLLEGVVADPDARISSLPILTEAEQHHVLVAWNATGAEYPRERCVHELIEAQVERVPAKTAVAFEGEALTYRELDQRANRLAHYLVAMGVGPETLVGVFMERCLETLVGLLGILKAGGAYVPLDPEYPRERLAYMMEDAGLRVVLTQERFRGQIPSGSVQAVYLDADAEAIARCPSSKPAVATRPEHLMYVIYTSGSTGKPKGVQVPHGAVVNFLWSMARRPGITEEDILVAVTTLSFDIHVLEIYLPLVVGAQSVLVSREVAGDGLRLLAALEDAGATMMQATPSTWRILLAAGWQGGTGFKALCGGEAFPADLASELYERVGELWNMYGPTETTVWSTCSRVEDPRGPILIGTPIANTTVYVLDRHGRPVPVGVPGELCIGGAGVTRGYLNRPELTAQRFLPDPFSQLPGARLYKTGDLVRYRRNGSLEYLGRLDTQVKVRGFRIELGEIETALTENASVRQAVVAAREIKAGDTRLVAYVVPSSGTSLTPTELRAHLRARLPEYMIPQHFVELDSLPLTPAGKIDRKGLPNPFETGRGSDTGYVAPATPTEALLASIWQEALGVERVGAHDNFFDLGGHSLLCMQVIERIRKQTGVRLSPRAILMNTLRQIAETLPAPGTGESHGDGQDRRRERSIAQPAASFLKRVRQRFLPGSD